MSEDKPIDLGNELEVPDLNSGDTLPEIIKNIAIIDQAIDKCEKILQHLAIGNLNEEFQKYMSLHIRLTSHKNKLYKKINGLNDDQDNH